LANNKITLRIAQGEIIGIFGPNGAGKTTLVRQIMGLLQPTSGTIHLYNHDVVEHPEIVSRFVGYYGQKTLALRAHKAREVLFITGLFRGQTQREANEQTTVLLERFELTSLANRLMSSLSGGEQRLIALLASFMAYSPVLILDEPTNELDPVRRRKVWEYLWERNQEHHDTVLLVTHNLLEAETVVARVVLIDQGSVQITGTPGELKREVEDIVRLEVKLRDTSNQEAIATLSSLPASECLRPGHWQITSSKGEASSLLSTVLDQLGMDVLDDFRLITPTLEGVYIKLTGKAWQKK